MAVTIITTPLYPAVGRDTRVDFALTGGGNYLRGYFTDAPIGSEAKTALLNLGASRIPAFDTDSNKPWQFLPDVGGVYTLQIEQYTKGAANYGGGYQGAPDGFLTESLIATSTATLNVGQKVTQRVGFGADTATLTLFVVADTVRASTFDQEGFTSPLISDAKSLKAGTASLNAAIVAAVKALANQTTTVLLGDIYASFNDLMGSYGSHSQSVTRHVNADSNNTPLSADPLYPTGSPEGLKRALAKLLLWLDQHIRNDTGATTTSIGGTGTGNYHVGTLTDWGSLPLGTTTGDTLDTFTAYADAWRSYESHRVNAAVHNGSTALHPASPLPPLLDIHRLFLSELAKQSPTAPASVNAGVTALVHGAGFEEA